jgi:hypothetical protein
VDVPGHNLSSTGGAETVTASKGRVFLTNSKCLPHVAFRIYAFLFYFTGRHTHNGVSTSSTACGFPVASASVVMHAHSNKPKPCLKEYIPYITFVVLSGQKPPYTEIIVLCGHSGGTIVVAKAVI